MTHVRAVHPLGGIRACCAAASACDDGANRYQVKGGLEREGVRAAAATGGVWRSLVAIGREEGLRGYWRGNVPQARARDGYRPFSRDGFP